jgi:Tol biopolymer transport system component
VAVAAGGDDKGKADRSAASASTALPQKSEQQLEKDEHANDSHIFLVNVRSSTIKELTSGQIAQQPSWAPAKRITFTAADCDDSCWSKLYYIDPQGRNQVLVQVKATHHLFHPTWSPDGRRIAAVALGRGIFSVPAGGSKIRKLTKGQSDEAPDWSPNSDWIAFDKRIGGTNYDIFAVNDVTRKVKRLTHDQRQQTNPAWSPDGSRIAFAEQQSNGAWAIFTMRVDGSGRKRVTGKDYSAQEPSWSPDGNRIAFVKQSLDRASIAVVGVDGGRVRTLTGKTLYPSTPTWSPDGRAIAFSAVNGQPHEQ